MAAVGVRAVLLTVVVVVMGAMTVHSQRVVEVEQQSRDTPQVPFLIGYYTNWGQYRPGSCSFKPPAIEPIANSLTHLHYAFAKIDTSGNVIPIGACLGSSKPKIALAQMLHLFFSLNHLSLS